SPVVNAPRAAAPANARSALKQRRGVMVPPILRIDLVKPAPRAARARNVDDAPSASPIACALRSRAAKLLRASGAGRSLGARRGRGTRNGGTGAGAARRGLPARRAPFGNEDLDIRVRANARVAGLFDAGFGGRDLSPRRLGLRGPADRR